MHYVYSVRLDLYDHAKRLFENYATGSFRPAWARFILYMMFPNCEIDDVFENVDLRFLKLTKNLYSTEFSLIDERNSPILNKRAVEIII